MNDDTTPATGWVCGHMAPGQPCAEGPGFRGRCPAAYHCTPVQVDGAWICDRPAGNGGMCRDGPTPDGRCCQPTPACRPKRSVRSRQDTLAAWFGVAVLGVVLAVISFSPDTRLLMPGPLSTSHSSVQDCAGCHANVGEGQFGWLHALVSPSNPARDSETCVACHKVGKGSMSPHGLTPRVLQAKLGETSSAAAAIDTSALQRMRDYLLPVSKISKEEVYCATCHKEHRNSKADMEAMADQRCQTCHQVQFERFDKDHPPFESYPFARRTRIKFNHSSHFDTHFPEWKQKHADRANTPDTCSGCHTPSSDNKHMNVKSFAQVCASCHADQIVGKERASGPQGVALFALPGIDLQTIAEQGLTVGEWPAESEAELTPLTKFLLGGSADRRKLLAKVEKLDLLDLTKASSDEVAAVVRLAWEIKRLLHALMATKTSEVMLGLGRSTGVKVDQRMMTKLVATLPRDVLESAQRDWLPNLDAEIKRLNENGWAITKTPKSAAVKKQPAQAAKPAAPSDEDEKPAVKPVSATAVEPPDRLSTNPKLGQWYVNAVGDLVQEGDPAAKPVPTAEDEAAPSQAEASEPDPPAAEEAAVAPTAPAANKVPLAGSAESWTEFGGWYRKDYAILYKPTGHEDAFMRAWLDFSGHAFASKGAALAAPVFELLSDKNAQGQCIKCHSVDGGAGNSRKVQWGASSVADKRQRFTKFVHEPHFQLLDGRGCMTCHALGSGKDFDKSYQSLDPVARKPNFKPVELGACATCHKSGAARQDCALCHDYHVAPVQTPITSTKLRAKAKPAAAKR